MPYFEYICKCNTDTEQYHKVVKATHIPKTPLCPKCKREMSRKWSATPRVWKCDKGGQP